MGCYPSRIQGEYKGDRDKMKISKIFSFILIILFFSSCATTGINKGQFNIISISEEIELGKRASKEVEKEMKVVKIPMVRDYINYVGQRLASHSDLKIPYHFAVIEDEEVNAFSLPGGYVYVFTGLIEATDNEAELAGVIGHEIGHIAARHATELLSMQKGINFLAAILFNVLGVRLTGAQAQLADITATLGVLHYNRSQEKEADDLGLKYMIKAGYNPYAMITFFEKLRRIHKENPNILTRILSTHPVTSERIRRVKEAIERMGIDKKDFITNNPQFIRIKTLLFRKD